MKFGVIVAARMGSSRLPGKALLPLGGVPILEFLLKRLLPLSPEVPVILATTQKPEDAQLVKLAEKLGVKTFTGSEHDLIERFVLAADQFHIDYPIRITADCPFLDAETIQLGIDAAKSSPSFDLLTTKRNFPVGIDFEIYSQSSMKKIQKENINTAHREHLTLYYYENEDRFKINRLSPPKSWKASTTSFTVDTPEDYAKAKAWVDGLGRNGFPVEELLK